mgnify:CR=1 FL=1
MIRLLRVAEIQEADTPSDADHILDLFREAVLPATEFVIVLYHATSADLADPEVERPWA